MERSNAVDCFRGRPRPHRRHAHICICAHIWCRGERPRCLRAYHSTHRHRDHERKSNDDQVLGYIQQFLLASNSLGDGAHCSNLIASSRGMRWTAVQRRRGAKGRHATLLQFIRPLSVVHDAYYIAVSGYIPFHSNTHSSPGGRLEDQG